jgi:hypothetical protein
MVWHRPVGSRYTVVVSYEWSTGPAYHCSHLSTRLVGINSATCPHVLLAMMVWVLGVSKTCSRDMETCEPSRIGRLAKPFIIL